MNNLIFAGVSDTISFKIENDSTYDLIKSNFPNIAECWNTMFFIWHPVDVAELLYHENEWVKQIANHISEEAIKLKLRDYFTVYFYI
jgi:hypothetical protein